jgi:membrane protein YdbS with pleckstrin-like domain
MTGALVWALPLLVAASAVAATAGGLPGWVRILGWLVAAAVVAAGVLVAPQLRWRRWRWELSDEELDLRHGTVTVVRTLVPIARVQHVDTERTVVSQLFGLAAVRVHTAAGATKIPALTEGDAGRVRDRIAALARVPDEL